MIAYRDITIADVVNEIIMRLGSHRMPTNIDWTTLLRYINMAIKEVTVRTLPYKSWAYTYQDTVSDSTVITSRYLGAIRLMVSSDGNPSYTEARKVDAKEYFETANIQRKNLWTQSTNRNPIYTLWGNTNTNPTQIVIYITPDTYSGIFEYYAAPTELVNPGDIIPVPYEFRNLIVMSAISRVYAKSKQIMMVETIRKEILEARKKVIELFQEKRRTEKRELDSFVAPVIPLVQKPDEIGELKKELN